MTVKDFKALVFDKFFQGSDTLRVESVDQFLIRNPKNDDLGDVVAELNDPLEQLFLYDGKELLVQKIDEDYRICQTTEQTPTYTILVREWRGDTWEFGTLYEVTIDKLLTCDKLAEFL